MISFIKALKVAAYLTVILYGILYLYLNTLGVGKAELTVINESKSLISKLEVSLYTPSVDSQSYILFNFPPSKKQKLFFSVRRDGTYRIRVKFPEQPSKQYYEGYLNSSFDSFQSLGIFNDGIVLKELSKE